MVVGSGLIARRFRDYAADDEKIIFASGVSNSKNINENDFLRETRLLESILSANKDRILIYFSTCSIEDDTINRSPYVRHKINTEHFIQQHTAQYHIFRVSNVAGTSNNPYTLLNYFVYKILTGQPFEVWKNAYRNIIDIDDMYAIIDKILRDKTHLNKTVNIANMENYSVLRIVKNIETHLNKKANFKEVDMGKNFQLDLSDIEPLIKSLEIKFDENYLSRLLKKYYHSK